MQHWHLSFRQLPMLSLKVENKYIGASMTGLNLSYNGSQDLNLGIQAKAGYFVDDDWMLLGQVEYNHSGLEGVKDYFSVMLRHVIISSRMVCIWVAA